MRRLTWSKYLRIPVAAAIVVAGLGPARPTLAAAAAFPVEGSAAADERWVTLITGDRVLVGRDATGDTAIMIKAGRGRESIAFRESQEDGNLVVLPVDAIPPVRAGTLDKRLFNVSELVRSGYDDRARGDIPLIIVRSTSDRTAVGSWTATLGVAQDRQLSSIHADAVRASKATTASLWQAVRGSVAQRGLAGGVSRIALDAKLHAMLDVSVAQIGAPRAWQAGHTGQGATVAVLDTGIDRTHPDLVDAVADAVDFTGSPTGAVDGNGHGTHVASIITGSAAASGGRYKGVAPDARLVVGKVLDDAGEGTESQVIAGMEWAAPRANVVNMSLGAGPTDGSDPVSQALNELSSRYGTLFVVAAGNDGPEPGSVGTPASADAALAVGAVDKQDGLAAFSSRGPRAGDHTIKPDLTAPGVDIVAARAAGTVAEDPVGDGYLRLSGTSMAAPHVAGAAAILAAEHPDLKAAALKALLMGSALPRGGLSVYEQGAGRVDVARATTQGIFATPASVSGGLQPWPHGDDTATTTTVTYHNITDAAVELALSADVHDSSGGSAPASMFEVSPRQVTVPAHGDASVQVAIDTAIPAPDGVYGGLLVATSAETVVNTPIGVDREAESYNVTLNFLDSQGRPTADNLVNASNVDTGEGFTAADDSGTVHLRLPKGSYYLDGLMFGEAHVIVNVEPNVVADHDQSFTLDARQAKPVGAAIDRPGLDLVDTILAPRRTVGTRGFGPRYFDTSTPILARPSTTSAPAGQFTLTVTQRHATPNASPDGRRRAAVAYLYHVQWTATDRVPADLLRRVHDRELTLVHSEIAATGPDETYEKDGAIEVNAPCTVTEYFTPGVPWRQSLRGLSSPSGGVPITNNVVTTFVPGGAVVKRWNAAVFGPNFPAPVSRLVAITPFALRDANTLRLALAPFSQRGVDDFGSAPATGSLTLHRDGQLIGSSGSNAFGSFDVPPDTGTYRLESRSTLAASTLSTQVISTWTFRSGPSADGTPRDLPLAAIRFAPTLNLRNVAPAGRFTFAAYVQRVADAPFGTPAGFTVDVSYDDGRTWRPAVVKGIGLNRMVTVTHPRGHGFVSLRATAADSLGNTVDQTVIRAYGY